MTLRIQCPTCQRQFKVSEDLRGRTVECGACENQFTVDEEVVVKVREKFYPGEDSKKGLERYARIPPAGSVPVEFQTTAYKGAPTAGEVNPSSPQRKVAYFSGIVILIFFGVLLLLGSQDNGLLVDMDHTKRIFLSSFVALVGAILVFYGGFHHKKEAVLTALALGMIVVVLSVVLPVPKTMDYEASGGLGGGEEPAPPVAPPEDKMTEKDVLQTIGYAPIEKAIATLGADAVVALWAPATDESFIYQIRNFLERTAKIPERPSTYRRGDGWLLVLEGTELSIPEVNALVDRFGRVDEVYPGIRVLRIAVEGERLLDVSADLRKMLTDENHTSFYSRNEEELDHINLKRVKEAALRLADADPERLRFRPRIAKRLIELLQEEADNEFKMAITRALRIWSVPGDGSDEAMARAVHDLLREEKEVPRSMMEFLIERDVPDVISSLEVLWKRSPTAWEPLLLDLGSESEGAVAQHLRDSDKAVQQSAARILRRIGTGASLPALREALAEVGGDEARRVLLESAIKSIEARSGSEEPEEAE